MEKLSPQQERFCREYAKSGNATESARLAGYGPADPKRTAMRLLQNPDIKKRIARLNKTIADAIEVSAVTLANEYKKIAFANFMDAYKAFITSSDPDISPDIAAAISDISIVETTKVRRDGTSTTTRRIKLKMHNKLRALEKLSKMCGVENGVPEDDEPGELPGDMVEVDLEQLSFETVLELHNACKAQKAANLEKNALDGNHPKPNIPAWQKPRYYDKNDYYTPPQHLTTIKKIDISPEELEKLPRRAELYEKNGMGANGDIFQTPKSLIPGSKSQIPDSQEVTKGDISQTSLMERSVIIPNSQEKINDTPESTFDRIAYLGYDPSIYKPPRRLGDIQL